MNAHESTPVKVGIFVFAGVFFAMAIIFLLGSEKQLFKRQYELTTTFKDISGLRTGAQVQLAGLNVGMVDKITFGEELSDKKVQVRLSINKEFQKRIRKDSVATINTQGLLGDQFIFLSLGSPEQEVLKDGDPIASEETASLYSIAKKFGSVASGIDKASESANKILSEINDGEGLLHGLIYETKERPMGANVAATTEDIRGASRELRQLLQKINRGEGTVGALMQDPSLYYDIRRLFARVERNKILSYVIRNRIKDLETEKIDAAPVNPSYNSTHK